MFKKASDWLWPYLRHCVSFSSNTSSEYQLLYGHRAAVQLGNRSGHLQMTSLNVVSAYISLSSPWCLSPCDLCLLLRAALSFLLSHPLIVVTFLLPSPSLSRLSLSHSLSHCVCCPVLVPQGSVADVIYAISFASERRERPGANTLHAECSCGRLRASNQLSCSLSLPFSVLLYTMISLHGGSGWLKIP